jgi:hypothetical protein
VIIKRAKDSDTSTSPLSWSIAVPRLLDPETETAHDILIIHPTDPLLANPKALRIFDEITNWSSWIDVVRTSWVYISLQPVKINEIILQENPLQTEGKDFLILKRT